MSMPPFCALFSGSRDWSNEAPVARAVSRLVEQTKRDGVPLTVVHGDARGLDKMAGDIAMHFHGGGHDVMVKPYPAAWKEHHPEWCKGNDAGSYCKYAGFRRNQEMLDEACPSLVLLFTDRVVKGFPGGGTGDMARRALDFRCNGPWRVDVYWYRNGCGWLAL